MGKYDVAARPLSQLQADIAEWGHRNFGPPVGPRAWQTALGIAEEVGELSAALRVGDEDGVADAVGDAVVYACAFCSHPDNNIDIARALDMGRCLSIFQPEILRAVEWSGKLSHCVLKRAQGIRGYDDAQKYGSEVWTAMANLLAHLDKIVKHYVGCTIEQAVSVTADEVLRRDWVAHRETGT